MRDIAKILEPIASRILWTPLPKCFLEFCHNRLIARSNIERLNEMLTTPESRQIAIDCVQHVGNAAEVKITSVLEEENIPDDVTLETLKRSIVRNKKIRVKSKGHRMKVKDFDSISVKSTVDDVAKVIRDEAEPI